MELHRVKTGRKHFAKKFKDKKHSPLRSFRNSRFDSRPNLSSSKKQPVSVTCAVCGNECTVPFIPKTDRPIYCSDCFRKNRPQDSNEQYNRYQKNSKFSKNRSRFDREDLKSKKSKNNKFLKKQESLFSGGSEKFYNTLKEKLFEILGGKVCSSCGFKDERALGFRHIYDEGTFDAIRRGGFASSWGKYISDPDLAREELKILCLNCNEVQKPIGSSEKKPKESKKKTKRFPR